VPKLVVLRFTLLTQGISQLQTALPFVQQAPTRTGSNAAEAELVANSGATKSPQQIPLHVEHPAERPIESRAQTQHKLELLRRYYEAWCGILSGAHGHNFCMSDLWIVEAHAGRGSHLSEGDPDGEVSGTPLHAARAAQLTQRAHPGVTVHVRAIEPDAKRATELGSRLDRYAHTLSSAVDVRVLRGTFEQRVNEILAEISNEESHPHSEGRRGPHGHRSLWFLDPYGWEEIPYRAVAALGPETEVLVNADMGGLKRLIGGAKSDHPTARNDRAILLRAFGDMSWAQLAAVDNETAAKIYANKFPAHRYRDAYHLKSSSSQDRWIVQMASSLSALTAFARDYKVALRAGTVAAGDVLTDPQRHRAAAELCEKYRGETLTIDDMFALGSGRTRNQIRTICLAAEESGFGVFNPETNRMEWFVVRVSQSVELTLGLV
jgi:three-Cys-motif partner protein